MHFGALSVDTIITIIINGVFNDDPLTWWGLVDLWNLSEVSCESREAVRIFRREYPFPFRARISRALVKMALPEGEVNALLTLGKVFSFSGDIVLQAIVYGTPLKWMRPIVALEGEPHRENGTEDQSLTSCTLVAWKREPNQHFIQEIPRYLLDRALLYRLDFTPTQSLGARMLNDLHVIFTTKHSDPSLSSFIPVRTLVYLGSDDTPRLFLGNIRALRRRELHIEPMFETTTEVQLRYWHLYSGKAATWDRRKFTVRCTRCNVRLAFGSLRKNGAQRCIGASEKNLF